jgi:hypothetical protein
VKYPFLVGVFTLSNYKKLYTVSQKSKSKKQN